MSFPVHYFTPGVSAAVCYREVFTPEQCDQIIAMCELVAHGNGGFQKGRIGTHVDGGEDNPETRVTDIVWLEPSRENDWVHHRISQITGRVNSEKFQLDLDNFDGFQFSRYESSNSGHYDWHIDVMPEPPNPASHRKLSLSVMLSNPDDYEGGDLLLNTRGHPGKAEVYRPVKGDVVFFYSFVPHRVTPVTKGVRNTLVTWACGEKFR